MSLDKKSDSITELEKGFRDKLIPFSKSITIEWLNSFKASINKTPEFDALIRLFSPLKKIFEEWMHNDQQEFFRTIIHTFQTQSAYNQILSGDFPESGLNSNEIKDAHDLAISIYSFSPLLIPAILWLHDIGRFEDKRCHNEKSAEMITKYNLLENRGISEEELILIRKVVQYHLLIGTLYTGESSYLSFEPLLKDKEFKTILGNNSLIRQFLDALTLFTMIDVWGYHINDISSTMIKNYLDIREEMKEIFAKSHDLNEIIKGLKKKSRKHMDWRLMGFMMAFSKIGKKPHLTLDYYAGMINDSFERYIEREGLSINWNDFKDQYLNKIDQAQFKYGLGVLIPLSYGGTGKKMHLTEDTRINPNLLHLLVNINKKILKEEETNPQCIPDTIWNVIFKGYPLWNRRTDFHEKLNTAGQIEEIINNSVASIDKKDEINILTVDYSGFWRDSTK